MAKAAFLVSMHHHQHINATLGLVAELVKRGEEVVYFFPEEFRSQIESTGAILYPVDKNELGIREDVEDIEITYGIELLYNHARDILGESKRVSEIMLHKVAAVQPDYIIHDAFTLWGKHIAAYLKIPAVCTISTFAYCDAMIDKNPDMLTQYVLRLSNKDLPAKYGNNALRTVFTALSSTLKRIYHVDDLMDVFTARENLNIVATSDYFHICREVFDDSYKFVGPTILMTCSPVEFPFEWIDGRPLIYIYVRPEFKNQYMFYTNCFEAFKDMEVQVVLSIGEKADLTKLNNIPSNILVRKQTPRIGILEKTSVFLTNEGFDDVYQALYLEVPLVTFSSAADQSLLSRRIEELGAGILIDKHEFTPEELRNAVIKVLNEETYKRNCRIIKESFLAGGSFGKAADEILAYLEQA